MIANRLLLWILVAALAASAIGACMPALTEHEAKTLADKRVAEYAEGENLDRASFGSPEISSEPGHPWVFDYTSNTAPRHLLRIYVNSREEVEIHRMVEE
jgi:outer membrane protein assembly factor BamE (lipoprotein component of BamABCDE complex)